MLHQLRRKWFMKREWGFEADPPSEIDEVAGKALLACVNGDGQVTQAERDWVVGSLSGAGFDESLLNELLSYSADEDVAEVIGRHPIVQAAPGVIIYAAILACDSDGELHPDEIATIRRMAEKLGTSDALVNGLLENYKAEKRLKEQRINLVFPTGAPF